MLTALHGEITALAEVTNTQKKLVWRGHFCQTAVFKRGQSGASKIKAEYINISQRARRRDILGSLEIPSSNPLRSLPIRLPNVAGPSNPCPWVGECPCPAKLRLPSPGQVASSSGAQPSQGAICSAVCLRLCRIG